MRWFKSLCMPVIFFSLMILVYDLSGAEGKKKGGKKAKMAARERKSDLPERLYNKLIKLNLTEEQWTKVEEEFNALFTPEIIKNERMLKIEKQQYKPGSKDYKDAVKKLNEFKPIYSRLTKNIKMMLSDEQAEEYKAMASSGGGDKEKSRDKKAKGNKDKGKKKGGKKPGEFPMSVRVILNEIDLTDKQKAKLKQACLSIFTPEIEKKMEELSQNKLNCKKGTDEYKQADSNNRALRKPLFQKLRDEISQILTLKQNEKYTELDNTKKKKNK